MSPTATITESQPLILHLGLLDWQNSGLLCDGIEELYCAEPLRWFLRLDF